VLRSCRDRSPSLSVREPQRRRCRRVRKAEPRKRSRPGSSLPFVPDPLLFGTTQSSTGLRWARGRRQFAAGEIGPRRGDWPYPRPLLMFRKRQVTLHHCGRGFASVSLNTTPPSAHARASKNLRSIVRTVCIATDDRFALNCARLSGTPYGLCDSAGKDRMPTHS